MKEITKENIEEFMNYYHGLHDSFIVDVNYDIRASMVEVFIDVYWSGEPSATDYAYDTHKTHLKMRFLDVEKIKVSEMFSWDYIMNAYVKYIKLDNKEYICFSDDEDKPSIYVVCESITYEEISKRDDEIIKIHEEMMSVYKYANKIFKMLKGDFQLGYFNKHLVNINKKYIEQDYYMPVISLEDKGDICFNFDNVSYEFYLPRKKLQNYLEVLIEKYADKLSVYTSRECDIDLYNLGDEVIDVNKRLDEYEENEVTGITIDKSGLSDKEIVDNFLELIKLFYGE